MSPTALSVTTPRPCVICGGKPLHAVWRAGGNEYSRCLTHEKTTDGRIIRLNPTGVWETIARNPATGRWESIGPPQERQG